MRLTVRAAPPTGALGGTRIHDGVGGDDAQHGGHAGGEHPDALDHPADPPGPVGGVQCDLILLGDRVGGQDRGSGVVPRLLRGGQGARGRLGSLQKGRHVDQDADHARGADQNIPGARTGQQAGDVLGGIGGIGGSPGPGAGIGRAGVEDDGARGTGRPRSPVMTPRDQTTGAAANRLVVNTPAATSSGPSLTTRPRSGLPEGLRPARTPAARKPRAAVTLMGRPPPS